MKKFMLCLYVILSSLVFPAVSNADYAIHLTHGGRFSTSQYWEKNNEIMFFNSGGVVGVEKNFVRKIEKLPADPYRDATIRTPERPLPQAKPAPAAGEEKKEEAPPAETEQKAEKNLSPQMPPVKIDLKPYQEKMAQLKADINETLKRIKKANTSKDQNAKDEATADNRRISAEMWKLTEELQEKNNGKLPADWWEGVGKEEPAIQ